MKHILSIIFISCCSLSYAQGVYNSGGTIITYDQQRINDSISARAKFVSDSISKTQKAQQIAALKSFAYKGLNGFTAGGTLTAAQIQEAIQLYLYNQGAFNPATNKIDSTLNYIK